MSSRIPPAVRQQRIEFLRAVLRECFDDNQAELGRRLTFKDGSLIGQWLRAERPITEASMLALSSLPEVKRSEVKIGVEGFDLAHLESLSRPYPQPPKTKPWEALPMEDLSRPFGLEVVDGSFGADFPPGCVMQMDPDRPPRGGWPLLVKDRDARFYLRDYQEGTGGRWQAVARVRGFAPLDSVDDGLEIVAVMRAAEWP